MLETKVFEIRDSGTFIPVLCVRVNASWRERIGNGPPAREDYLIRRAGYGTDPLVIMTALRASNEFATYKYYAWEERESSRTRTIAHKYIIDHWGELQTGDVIDVQFILGETSAPCRPEMHSVEQARWEDSISDLIDGGGDEN